MTAPYNPNAAVPILFLTPTELALRWRKSSRTLDRWRRDRNGPPWVELGGRILYRVADVEAFEALHRRPVR